MTGAGKGVRRFSGSVGSPVAEATIATQIVPAPHRRARRRGGQLIGVTRLGRGLLRGWSAQDVSNKHPVLPLQGSRRRQQSMGCRIQRSGQLRQYLDGQVSPPPFDLRNVGPVKAGFESQLLLRQTGRLPCPAHVSGHNCNDVRAVHRTFLICITMLKRLGPW